MTKRKENASIGRPPVFNDPNDPPKAQHVNMPLSYWEAAKDLGGGVASKGIRKALDMARKGKKP